MCVCVQDRPSSAVDQMGLGDREVGRTRMSVEEQLERMRRNQEASSLRERRREPLSRSASFNRDNPFVLQVIRLSCSSDRVNDSQISGRQAEALNLLFVHLQTRLPADGGSGADPLELEAALQQLQVTHTQPTVVMEPSPEVPSRYKIGFLHDVFSCRKSTNQQKSKLRMRRCSRTG